jgi:hypothetical protein
MLKKIITITLILVTASLVFLTSCYKVTTLTANNEQEITTPVSLASDLLPLFGQNCSLSGCHNTGGIKPDLSADKAYNSIVNGNYVDLATPENSEIYLWLTGKKAASMPIGAANNPSNINQYVLAWIKQGAQNN